MENREGMIWGDRGKLRMIVAMSKGKETAVERGSKCPVGGRRSKGEVVKGTMWSWGGNGIEVV